MSCPLYVIYGIFPFGPYEYPNSFFIIVIIIVIYKKYFKYYP